MPCCRLLQRLIFVDGTAIDAAVIATLPAQLGIDTEAFRRDLDGPQTKARHDGLLDEARARGAFGVPTFFLGNQMFWGNDRLVLLEAAIGGKAMPEMRR